MSLKRHGEEVSVVQTQPKKSKVSSKDFFAELCVDDDIDSPSKKKVLVKKRKKKNKSTASSLAWTTGSDDNILKYVRVKEMVDIPDLIRNYLQKHKIVLDIGDAAGLQGSSTKLKAGEAIRLERLKNLGGKKKSAEAALEDYFKDSITIDSSKAFNDLIRDERLLKAIKALKYVQPTPIQSATIPVALAGKDICGCAATGTGKTAAYMLPTIQRLLLAGPSAVPVTRVLVLVPTRELGVQVFQVAESLAKFTNIRVGLAAGGLRTSAQKSVLGSKPDIVIATPGRLMTYIKNWKKFTLEHIEILILDEADRMLDEHFAEQMIEVIHQCSPHRQTLLFSATMTTEVKTVAVAALKTPVKIFVDSNTRVAQGLRQEYIMLKSEDTNERCAILLYLLLHEFTQHTLVFLPTKALCHRLYVMLHLCGLKVGELHGRIPQSARLQNLALFAKGKVRVLLATDVAARGLDVKGVDTVINYQLHSSYKTYVHRVGRTARAGNIGLAISIIDKNGYSVFKSIRKESKTPLFERSVNKEIVTKFTAKLVELNRATDEILAQESVIIKERFHAMMQALENNANQHNLPKQKTKAVPEEEKEPEVALSLVKLANAAEMTVEQYLLNCRIDEVKDLSSTKKKKLQRLSENEKNHPRIEKLLDRYENGSDCE